MIEQFKAGTKERTEKRAKLSKTLAQNGYEDVLVSTREKISGFGIKEWTLITLLDNAETEEITVPDHCWNAAYTLAKADMVTLTETEDTLTAQKRHDGGVFVQIL